jgi:hypothetical protein
MGIQIGDTPVLMQDPSGKLDEYIERFHSLDLMRAFGQASAVNIPRGSNLLFPNYPTLPAPRLNQLVIPTGATRWSYGLFLVTAAMRDAILAKAAANSNRVTVYFGDDAANWKFQPSGSSAGNFKPIFQMTMSPLPPRPIHPPGIATTADIQDLWVLPMVDQRYWWQNLNVGPIQGEGFSSVQEMIDYLNGKLNGTATMWLTCPNPRHDKLPDITAGNDFENIAVMIESLAWHLGCQLVPEVNVNSSRSTATALDTGFALVSVDDSPFIHAKNLAGKVGMLACSRVTNGTFESPGTGWENVGIPVVEMGGPIPVAAGSAFLPESIQLPSGDGFVSRKATDVGLTTAMVRTVAGTSAVLRLKWKDSATPSDALRDQCVKDFYNRFRQIHDYTFAGVQKWQPTAFDDCIVMSQARFTEHYGPDHEVSGFKVLTRVRSWMQNLLPQVLSSASVVSSGSGGSGCGCACIDAGDIVVNGVETSSKWTIPITKPEVFEQANGDLIFPAGSYIVTWNAGRSKWVLNVTSMIQARFNDGTSATLQATGVAGELTMEWAALGSAPLVTLEVNGTIPPKT